MSVSDRQRPGANTSDVDDCVWVTVQCLIHVFLVPILCNVVFFRTAVWDDVGVTRQLLSGPEAVSGALPEMACVQNGAALASATRAPSVYSWLLPFVCGETAAVLADARTVAVRRGTRNCGPVRVTSGGLVAGRRPAFQFVRVRPPGGGGRQRRPLPRSPASP